MRSAFRRLAALGRASLRRWAPASPASAGTLAPTTSPLAPILRPSDQAVVGVGALLGLLLTATAWLAAGGAAGRLTEPGEQPRLTALFRVDVNTAPAAELQLLPSIGDVRAQEIVRERQRGAFISPDDLARRVHGIGPKTADKMKPYLAPMDASGELVASLKGSRSVAGSGSVAESERPRSPSRSVAKRSQRL